MRAYQIGIYGSYGGMNLGDEAILQVIINEIRKRMEADITVFSSDPADTTSRLPGIRALPVGEIQKDKLVTELRSLDVLIIGGGGIFFNEMADNYLRVAAWAKHQGTPVFVLAVSAGPLTNPETKKMLVDVLNTVDKITVRDEETKKLFNDLGVDQEIIVTADPAVLLDPGIYTLEDLEKQGVRISGERPLVGVSVREPGKAAPDLKVEHYHEILANAADFMIERINAQILFVPLEKKENKDFHHSHAVIANMVNAQSAQVLKGDFSSSQILALMKHMDFAVGMRLHFLIFAAIQGIPFVPLPYASKVTSFLNSLNIPVPPLKEVNSGKLCAFLDRFWDNRRIIQQSLSEKFSSIKNKSEWTFDIFSDFMQGKKAKMESSNSIKL
jgi:polysaccharide pyruvyl transferase CsaB